MGTQQITGTKKTNKQTIQFSLTASSVSTHSTDELECTILTGVSQDSPSGTDLFDNAETVFVLVFCFLFFLFIIIHL